uniref:Uncharacterized protein n=1 Tax=Labrus bergylta TaxID=56723 RepID=A0A3Q3F9Y0_9LABR
MAAQSSTPSDLYKCVYSFLLQNKFTKAAQQFLKQTKVTPQDENEESLVGIYNFWVKSPEAKKRKAPSSTAEATNGPSAKKAKKSQETSSSEESSSEDEEAKPTKAAPAGKNNIYKNIVRELLELLASVRNLPF